MTGYEVLLSESQERMLLVVAPEHEADVRARLSSAGSSHAVVIGRVIEEPWLRAVLAGTAICEVPGRAARPTMRRAYVPPRVRRRPTLTRAVPSASTTWRPSRD